MLVTIDVEHHYKVMKWFHSPAPTNGLKPTCGYNTSVRVYIETTSCCISVLSNRADTAEWISSLWKAFFFLFSACHVCA